MRRLGRVILVVWLVQCGGLLAEPAFTFDDVIRLIETQKIRTLAELLPRLPKELRANYTLMARSGSLQEGSPSHPRAILFGKDASLILAFNGDPKLKGYGTLEAIQFRRGPPQTLEFREIEFPKNRDGPVYVSGKNPASCTGCHGSTPTYRWANYFVWPGAYGAVDDFLGATEKLRSPLSNLAEGFPNGVEDPRYQLLLTQEGDYRNFRKAATTHALYRNLLPPADQKGTLSPYHTVQEPDGSGRTIAYMPNSRLGFLVARRASLQLFDAMKAQPLFRKYRFLMAFSALDCQDGMVDPKLRKRENWENLRQTMLADWKRLGRRPPIPEAMWNTFYTETSEVIGPIHHLLFPLIMGEDYRDWYLASRAKYRTDLAEPMDYMDGIFRMRKLIAVQILKSTQSEIPPFRSLSAGTKLNDLYSGYELNRNGFMKVLDELHPSSPVRKDLEKACSLLEEKIAVLMDSLDDGPRKKFKSGATGLRWRERLGEVAH